MTIVILTTVLGLVGLLVVPATVQALAGIPRGTGRPSGRPAAGTRSPRRQHPASRRRARTAVRRRHPAATLVLHHDALDPGFRGPGA